MRIFKEGSELTQEVAEDIVRECWEPTHRFDEALFRATCRMLMQVHAAMLDAFAKQLEAILADTE